MNVLDSETDLCKPIKDLIFVKKLFVFLFVSDRFGEIPTFSIFHDNFEFILFGDVDLNKFDDIGVIEIFEDLRFFNGLISLLLWHVIDVHFLDDKQFAIGFSLDEVGLTKSALSQ